MGTELRLNKSSFQKRIAGPPVSCRRSGMGRMVQRNINLVAVNRYQSHCRGNVQIDTKNADRILAQDPQKLPLCRGTPS